MHTNAQVIIQTENNSGCAPFGVVINVTSPTNGISSYSWVITTPTGSILTASSPQYVSIFNTPGSYDVQLTINGNQTVTEQEFITVYSKPTASFIVDDALGCYPHCVSFTNTSIPGSGAITNTTWDFGNGNTSVQNNPSYCYPAAGNFNPILSIADENGCFSNYTLPSPISVNSNFPNSVISSTQTIVCGAPGAVPFINSSTGNGPLNFTWDFGDGQVSNASTNTLNHTYANEGTYTACLTAVDAEQCSSESCIEIFILDNPQAAFTVSDSELCTGQPLSFTISNSPQPLSVQWDFDGNGTVDNTVNSPSYTYPTSGTYTPQLIANFGGGCTSTFSGPVITVLPGIALSISASQTNGCELPFQTNISANVSGTGPFTYDWLINGAVAGETPVISPVFNQTGSYNVTLIVTNAAGCAAGAAQGGMIQVTEPTLTFTVPNGVCFGDSIQATNVSLSDNQEIISYSWDFNEDGIPDSNSSNPYYSYSLPGTFHVNLTVETAGGCVINATAPEPTIAQAALLPEFSSSVTQSCAGEAIEFCISQVTGNTYSWNFHDQTGWITMDETTDCIEHMYEDTGYFDLSLSIINGVCSLNDTLENYIYIEPPVALFEYSVNCNDLVTVTVSDQSIGADNLSWDFGDGSPVVTNVSEYTHVYSAMGSYDIVLTATSATMSCPDTKTHTLLLRPPLSEISFSDTVGCGPFSVNISEIQYNAHWSIHVSNGDLLLVDWDDNQGMWHVQYSHSDTLEDYFKSGSPFPTLVFHDAGCYDFEIASINEFGCPSTAFYESAICVLSNSDFADFEISPIETCDSVLIQFDAIEQNVVSTQWSFSDGGSATGNQIQHEFFAPFDYSSNLTATLSAVDLNGCTSSITKAIPIILPAIPQFSITGSPSCENTPITFTSTSQGNISQTEWTFGDGMSSIGQEVSHEYTSSGFYTVCLTVTTSDNGCQRTLCEENAVHINNPEVQFTYSSTINNCLLGVQFENTTITDVAEIVWDFGDNQTGGGASTFHTYPLGIYDVVLKITNIQGCTDSIVVADIFNFGDVIGPYSVVQDETPCAPFHIELSAFNINDESFTYFWDFNDGNGDPSGNTIVSHDYLSPGTYCPQLIMSDSNGCQVYVPCENPIVVEEFVLSYIQPAAICQGDSILFEAYNADSYSWNNSQNVSNTANENAFYLHPNETTLLLLTGVLDDCQRTDTIFVTVNPLPDVDLVLPESVCFDSPEFELTGGLPSGDGGSYFVNGNLANTFNPSLTAGLYHEVEYSFVDSLGCSSTVVDSIFIQLLPDVDFPAFGTICENSGEFFFNTATPAGGQYMLDAISVASFNPNTGYGSYPITYVYVDENGCENSDSQMLVVRDVPEIDFLFETICLNEGLSAFNTAMVNDGSIVSALWSFQDAATSTELIPQSVYFSSPGEKAIHVAFTSEHGCVGIADTTISVNVIPTAQFTLEDGCQDTDLFFTSTSTIPSGNIVGWTWSFEGVEFIDDEEIAYSFHDWGVLPASLIATSDLGCSDTLTQYVSVYQTPQVQLFANDVCLNTIANVYSEIELEVGEILEYQWDFGDGSVEPNTVNAENLYQAPGQYIISLTALSNLGCVGSADTIITVFDLPSADFAIIDDYVCSGELIELVDLSSSASSISTYEWYLDQELVSEAQNASFTYFEPGHYHVMQRVITEQGCIDDTTFHFALQIKPTPVAAFHLVNENLNMISSTVDIRSDASFDVNQWTYDLGDGELVAGEDVLHTYSNHGVYIISQYVVNPFGCSDSVSLTVTVEPALFIFTPNAFTPDGNGNNDVFLPVISGTEVLQYKFEIFDRWGKKVFETYEVGEGWNGQFMNNGVILQDGVYTWAIQIRSIDQPVLSHQKGNVTLLK